MRLWRWTTLQRTTFLEFLFMILTYSIPTMDSLLRIIWIMWIQILLGLIGQWTRERREFWNALRNIFRKHFIFSWKIFSISMWTISNGILMHHYKIYNIQKTMVPLISLFFLIQYRFEWSTVSFHVFRMWFH